MPPLYPPPTWPPPNGGLPQMQSAMRDWFQPMRFAPVVKTVKGYQASETVSPIDFRGVMQPLTTNRLMIKPEGQRTWQWWLLHAETQIPLKTDDVVTYLGSQLRIMGYKDYSAYGYYEYELITDYSGSGPQVVTP